MIMKINWKKKKHNLRVENYVLFDGLDEDIVPRE